MMFMLLLWVGEVWVSGVLRQCVVVVGCCGLGGGVMLWMDQSEGGVDVLGDFVYE